MRSITLIFVLRNICLLIAADRENSSVNERLTDNAAETTRHCPVGYHGLTFMNKGEYQLGPRGVLLVPVDTLQAGNAKILSNQKLTELSP